MTDFMSANQAARLLGCNRRSILRYLESGELQGLQCTARGWWKITRASVQKKLDKLDRWDSPANAFER
jgi:excisionase family DNA binding protein